MFNSQAMEVHHFSYWLNSAFALKIGQTTLRLGKPNSLTPATKRHWVKCHFLALTKHDLSLLALSNRRNTPSVYTVGM
jgi:hypothetical protein